MASRQQLPDWLYESLPYLYAGVGLLTIFVLRNAMAVFSGLTLLSAAVVVAVMRVRCRRGGKGEDSLDASSQYLDQQDKTRFLQLSWRSAFASGHPVIDAQHRRLFGISNQLVNAVVGKHAKDEIEALLEELIDHVGEHFVTEEALLAKTAHPVSERHKEIHQALLTKARELRDRYCEGCVEGSDLIGFIVYDVVNEHITKEDLKPVG